MSTTGLMRISYNGDLIELSGPIATAVHVTAPWACSAQGRGAGEPHRRAANALRIRTLVDTLGGAVATARHPVGQGQTGHVAHPTWATIEGRATIETSSDSPYHVGLTPDSIIDAAVEFSYGKGLAGWSVRELGKQLQVTPSVLYHHVGGKDLLRRHVVERVLLTVNFPTEVLPWRDWFRAALFPARPILASYPGVARWLLLHGPVFASMMPVVDSGVASLQRDGFGQDTAYAYTTLFNTALMTIAASDDRLQHEADDARDHAALRDELVKIAGDSPGIALIARDLMTQFTGAPEAAAAARDHYYRHLLERLMDGLEHDLGTRPKA